MDFLLKLHSLSKSVEAISSKLAEELSMSSVMTVLTPG